MSQIGNYCVMYIETKKILHDDYLNYSPDRSNNGMPAVSYRHDQNRYHKVY